MKTKILQAAIMSGAMALILSGVMVYINIGWVEDFMNIWGRNFLIAYIIALPLSMALRAITGKVLLSR